MFKVREIMKIQQISCYRLYLKLFDCLVRPILTYGCEVWGTYLAQYVRNDTLLISQLDSQPTEMLTNKFYKHILGLKKHAPNTVTRGELGRYPLYIYILKQVMN